MNPSHRSYQIIEQIKNKNIAHVTDTVNYTVGICESFQEAERSKRFVLDTFFATGKLSSTIDIINFMESEF